MKTKIYSGFGLNISSEIPLEFFKESNKEADVYLEIGDVPKYLKESNKEKKISTEIVQNKILQKSDKYNYLILDGEKIVVPAGFSSLRRETRIMFLEIFVMYIWLQRGALIFHGSAVEVENKVNIFMGDGGAGKSTTSLFFRRKGHEKFSDDMCIVFLDENKKFNVVPSCISENLTENTLSMFNIPKDGLKKMPGEEKYVSELIASKSRPRPLGSLFYLEKGEKSDNLKFKEIEGIKKIKIIYKNLLKQRESKISESKKGKYIKTIMHLIKKYPIISIKRPKERNSLDEIYKSIINEY